MKIAGRAAAVGDSTSIQLDVSAGSDYVCDFDTGDGRSFQQTYVSTVVHSDTVNHTYDNAGVFTVTVRCHNNVSQAEDHVSVTVLYPITGLRLTRDGAPQGSPFKVEFTLESGSSPNFTLLFDGTVTSVAYDNATLIGRSDLMMSLPLGVHAVVLKAENAVSSANVTANFTIAVPIANAQSTVNTSWAIMGEPLQFTVQLDAGSGIRITWDFNDSSADASVSTSPTDEWPAGNNRSSLHVFPHPGRFVVNVSVGNSLGEQNFVHEILVYGPVDNMTLSSNSPVMFLSGSGNIELRFVTSGFPPTAATVEFDYGDGDVSGQLTFDIANVYDHRYTKQGVFVVRATVTNRLRMATYETNIVISQAVQDMHVFVRPPGVAVGKQVVVAVTLEKGTDVTLHIDWGEPDGAIVSTPRRGKSVDLTRLQYYCNIYDIHTFPAISKFA